MKKTFKRAGVAVLSMAMLLSMGAMTAITSNATDATITINTGKLPAGSSLKVYKVATVDSSGEWAWSAVLPTSITSSYDLNGSTYTADNAKAAAAALAEWITDTATAENKTALGEKSATIAATGSTVLGSTQGVDNSTSYYLIIPTSTDAGKVIQPIMVEAIIDSNKVVNDLKMSDLPFDKKITAVSATIDGKNYTGLVGKDGDTGAGAVGDTVSYQITTQFPTYAANVTADDISNFVVTDTPTNISLKTGTVKVYIENGTTAGLQTTGSDADTVVTSNLTVTEGSPAGGFTATFNGTLIKANEGKNVYITYDSTIAATATYFATGNPNTARLTYGNEYATGGGSGTAEDRTTVYTAKLNLKKTGSDKSGGANLDGATFQLLRKDTSGNYNVIATSTGTSGDFEFTQLAPGQYKLHESVAPDGYLAIDDVSFTVSADSESTQSGVDSNNTIFSGTFNAAVDATVAGFSFDTQTAGVNDGTSIKATVVDPKRGELPGTGGMGTILFTVGGAAIVLLAGALFVVYMRKRKVEE